MELTESRWIQMVEGAAGGCLDASARFSQGSPEWEVLSREPLRLQRMLREVRCKPPGLRETVTSRVLAFSLDENVSLPDSVLVLLGQVYDAYHRWANTDQWDDSARRRQSSDDVEDDADLVAPPTLRRRAGITLLAMAGIVVFMGLWDVGNRNFHGGWVDWPRQLFRLAVPLALIYAIWTGRAWARYLLAGVYLLMLCGNFSTIMLMPNILRAGNLGDVVLVASMIVGFPSMIALSLFSPAIRRLIKHRRREKKKRQART
jgi:hypothetical protein